MDVWWWVPIGLAAWCLASVVIALCIGPVLRRSSQVRESLDQQFAETSDRPGKPVPAARRASDSTVARQR
jgi:hypothetical protein